MSFILSFFCHAQAAQAAALAHGLTATMQLQDYALRLDGDGHAQTWRAKFMASKGGRLCYTDQPGPETVGFAGWVPHAPRQWPIATDKGVFKRYAIDKGIRTPAACIDPDRIGGPFIIKGETSSFGEGLRGPFLAYDAADPGQALGSGEYYENFILGQIAKAWCWGDECVAVHMHRPIIVTGDGESSIRGLVSRLPAGRQGDDDWDMIGRLAQYCGIGSVDEVLPPGKEVLVDYRYGSRYEAVSFRNPNLLPRIRGTPLEKQLSSAAATAAQAIAEDAQGRRVVYTLDAVVDSDGVAWFLEVNCNPVVHPDMYGRVLADRAERGDVELPEAEPASAG